MSNNRTNDSELLKRITSVVSKVLDVQEDDVKPESDYVNDLGADSLDRATLLLALEDVFKQQIPTEDMVTLTTVGATVAYIEAKLLAPE